MLIFGNNSFCKAIHPLSSTIHIFLLFYCALLFFVSPSINAGDASELTAAAWYLGIPHPPGYPLYTLFAKAATFLPFGNVAFRVNLLSLLFAALVCAMFLPVTNMIAVYFGRINNVKSSDILISSYLSALVFAASPSFSSYLLVSEVYALNALLFFLILLLGLKCYSGAFSLRTMFFTAFLSGLAIGNHHTVVLMLPLALLFVPALKRMAGNGRSWCNFSIMISFFLLGLSVYIYLPIRSVQNPLLDWGDPQSLDLFLDVFCRRGYGGDPLLRSFDIFLQQLKSFDLPGEFGLVGLIFGACGLYSFWRGSRIVSTSLALTFFFFSYLIIVLSGNFKGDPEILKPFYIPALLIIAVLISLGILYIIRKLESFISGKAAYLAVIFMLLLGLYSKIVAGRPGDYVPEDFLPFDYAANTLKSMEYGSRYLAYIDSKVFALWYLQMVERYRDDIEIVPVDFLSRDWYSTQNYRRAVRPHELDLMVKGRVYTASLDESGLFPDGNFFSKGLTLRLGEYKEKTDTGVWGYYTLRGLNSPVGVRSYEHRNILSDYASAYFNLGIDQYMGGKPEEASHAYKKSLAIRPGNPDVLNNISLSYADMGINLLEAEAMAKSAIEGYTAGEKKINATDTLGWIYYRMGRYQDAFATLDMCSDVLSKEPSYQYHLGMTLFALNKLSEAEHLFSMAIPMLAAKAREDALLAVGSIRKSLGKGE